MKLTLTLVGLLLIAGAFANAIHAQEVTVHAPLPDYYSAPRVTVYSTSPTYYPPSPAYYPPSGPYYGPAMGYYAPPVYFVPPVAIYSAVPFYSPNYGPVIVGGHGWRRRARHGWAVPMVVPY